MGVREIDRFLEQWQMDARDLHRQIILSPTPQERERWHAIWLLAQGCTASGTAEALERDPHIMGRWAAAFGEGGPVALIFEQSGGVPPALSETQQAELEVAVQELPEAAGIGLANWNWRVDHRFVSERFGLSLSRSSCLNYLHRLGFAFKRPKKRLLKADEAKRESFVAEYGALWVEAERTGGKIFFADEAHFRADAELRGKWVMKGTPALVDSTSPRYGEKASYYSAVCLETGDVEWMELEGNSNSGISAAFLNQLRQRRSGQLNVIWDNAPAHRGAAVQQRVGSFLAGLASRSGEVKRRCRTVLQSRAEALPPDSRRPANAHPTLALV